MGWNHNFLRTEETILMEGVATKKNFSAVAGAVLLGSTGVAMSQTTGRLFLTNMRLVLVKHVFLMFGSKVVDEIMLRMVDSVTEVPDKFYNYIKIDTKDEKSRLFDVAPGHKEEWLKKFADALEISD